MQSAEDIQISVFWLHRLRWGAVIAQIVLLFLAVFGLDFSYPSLPLIFFLIFITAVSNFLLPGIIRQYPCSAEKTLGAFVLLDVITLTGLLALTGGASNPFSIFYLVHVSLASVILGSSWTWLMAGISSAGFALLFFISDPSAHSGMDHGMNHGGDPHFSSHLRGMWLAFTAAAILVAYFQDKTLQALRKRDREARALELRLVNQERLAAVTSLAAGAAHELGTPLSTISVAASELHRAIRKQPELSSLLEDAELIGEEVERCRQVIEKMIAGGGETPGEMPAEFSLQELQFALSSELQSELGVNTTLQIKPSVDPQQKVFLPLNGLLRSVKALVTNARYATHDQSAGKVDLELDCNDSQFAISVCDNGSGMDQQILKRLGEPFFSTKPPGKGMGIGIFLVKLYAERLGGWLDIVSEPGQGTNAKLIFPRVSQ